ncbi:MAG: proline--tRNA ligase [Candidatus Bathyarchaeota archaeon]|nr:proline--tRNA ligase [Candidatus Bathyarchaeota archaeon]MDH5494473.1 proline--tRNA ligase [Candidatus Bathyarchaeota archaeon]
MLTSKREKRDNQFGEWFRQVLIDAEILDYRYPIKGCGVWLPYGHKMRRLVTQQLRNLHDATGHDEIQFPIMVTETNLRKEAAHIKDFENEVFWITHGGLKPLEIRYALRPTSETAIYPMLKIWIRSHADLPKKLYQIGSVFRYETKTTRPIIRVREVTTFKEAHTSHATLEDAEAQVKEATQIYKDFFNACGVPYVISRRPDWDKFPGALYSISFDVIMPDGRTLQSGTVHSLGQNFSKAFDIQYETLDGEHEYIWQTCYGISERGIGSIISVHGDDNGIVLTPLLAPIQVIIIPIPHKKSQQSIMEACEQIAEKLKSLGFRAEIDKREELTPGAKFFHWELRGVPIRIEIGPKDVQKEQIILVRRDTFKKEACKISDLPSQLPQLMDQISTEMREKAWKWMKKRIYRVDSLEKANELLRKRAGIIELFWCGTEECGHKLEERVNASLLGTPVDIEEKIEGKCLVCGKKASNLVRVAITY